MCFGKGLLTVAFGPLCCGGIFFGECEADVFGDVDVAKHPDFVDGGEETRGVHGIRIQQNQLSPRFQKNSSGET